MTREEAIERLKNYTQYRCSGVDLVAINMAIQALESQPRFLVHSDGKIEQIIEPCDDCVSRQVVNDLYDRYHPRLATHVYEFGEELKALPSVTPKREQGEWIEHPHECGENWEFSKYECSICHVWEENDSDFCPNCGAEMR